MNFTTDWLTPNLPNFEQCLATIPTKKNFLEVGCFEGRTTCWLLKNVHEKGMSMTCVDTFTPEWYTGENLRKVFDDNIRSARRFDQVISVYSMKSALALAQLIGARQTYDFIYIDGDHSAAGVLSDATMAWQLLNQGGVMLFDDYEYPQEPTKKGIDAFLECFDGKYDLILRNYQLAVRKK